MQISLKSNRSLAPLSFGVGYIIPLLVVWGAQQGGVAQFAVPLFVFGLIPVLDLILGHYLHNPSPEESEALLNSLSFRLMTWLQVPIQYALILGGAWLLSHRDWPLWEQIGFTLSVGICTGGLGITLAHELIHKVNRWERFLGQALLLPVCYLHFYIEHLYGHHRRVATPEDPASARLGETVYRFYFRSVLGSWKSAWGIEGQRLKKREQSVWSVKNRMLQYFVYSGGLGLGLTLLWGWTALFFYLGQSLVAFSLLEAVNYVEHYGLERQQIREGVYEGVNIRHSWNANFLLTNCLLFMLQRHSDHHAHQSRRYPVLRQFEESPQLPAGYAGMLLLALIPPLWKGVMDPRVRAYRQQVSGIAPEKSGPSPLGSAG
ncbi:alkane 1-monooxygenase [bacterium (Candidatus Blackallbacteria) CG17_big_fil_post_rev_8_21_14_2_50_48_46]|uniref:Alkane 1-monooxygenase n=1 Tax=bacterium (Candidatus Blackallbacteria) CG17_big_fil_post_rev_8_21_14_2_50_48_46 TaxID=2014261 RepID=A0A2M7G200_9BACT|nr:MAG: alkane 1-monooxygenase [bacterium (Candidatus Blackallbacteria) CG18_big_fil_WC_8_21_14_2_50_49_26]PIW15793.1 MAG: alkane 1-monooxygenase [bacterium (Candidatus Blackallbacteria) CG17_big_fil_post_rev_8_21_14_2_50_48_46]PIW47778.1 MAG: alkane 1-monooxygenase [bacterium (Candidatus Blackallbacteria) CG13_big_fil_rev_8_21_14_2_50_49_14]